MKRIVILALISSLSLAIDNVQVIKKDKTSTYNEIDDEYKVEKGFYFYEDTNNTKAKKRVQRCDCKKIMKTLDSIDKSLKTQTKIQEKILKILEERFDPKPKVITVNGKKCVANSSAECFDMPLTPAAKRVPVLANLIKNPSLQTAARYLQWQAKYFKQIYKVGDSLPAAVTQFGSKAYPLNYTTISYTDLNGFNAQDKMIAPYLDSLLKKYNIHFLIFFGINKDLDITSVFALTKIIKSFPHFKGKIIFKSQKDKDIFDSMVEVIPLGKNIKKQFTTLIDKNSFDKLDIFTTPSIVIRKGKSAQTIERGKIQEGVFKQKLFSYFEMNNLIEHQRLNDYNSWKDNLNYRQNFYYHMYGGNINKVLEEKQKKSKTKGEK